MTCTDVYVRPQTCDRIYIYPSQVHPSSDCTPAAGGGLGHVHKPGFVNPFDQRHKDDEEALLLVLLLPYQ